ncbi:MAG TPA: hypothetical protein VNU44_04320 [Bryobacteraceae bacterium]|jgi:hypothetical protein|nr:hypothetical protein [Bryobacteraceae bacterium]
MASLKRTAQEVIDAAIRENRPNEYILYAFAILFVGLGTGSFIFSMWSGHWTLSIGSALESGLFYPAMNAVQKIRRENHKDTATGTCVDQRVNGCRCRGCAAQDIRARIRG